MALIDPSRFPAKTVHAAGALCCAALLAAGYFAGGDILLAGETTPTQTSDRLHDAESDAALKEAAVQRLELEVEHAQRQLDDKPMSLLPASVMNQRLADLSALAQAHELTLTTSQPGQETQLAYYAFVPISVGGEGRLASFVAFLGALHGQYPDMGVRRFDVTRDPMGGGQFTLTLSWYVKPSRTAEAS